LTSTLGPEAITARKAAVQAQIEALAQANLPKEDLDAARAGLEQLLKVLMATEEAFQQRATYMNQLETLPPRLQELTAEHKALAGRQPRSFPQATEQLREEYEAQLQTLRTALQEINQQTAAGEVRLAAIPRDLEQRARDRQQLEKDLFAAQSKLTRTGDQKHGVEVDILDAKLQLIRAEEEALKAEREWLTKHAPLQDTRLSNTQTRLKLVQQELDTIKESLSKTIQQEQSSLSNVAAKIEQKLEQTADPIEAFKLTVGLQTVDIQQHIAEYRQKLNQLGTVVLEQEKENAQLKQEVNRLTSLVEKYSSGEGIAQRLVVVFERLRRKRLRYSEGATRTLESQLRTLTAQCLPWTTGCTISPSLSTRACGNCPTVCHPCQHRSVTPVCLRYARHSRSSAPPCVSNSKC
jgi:chromosome segregation ATPase